MHDIMQTWQHQERNTQLINIQLKQIKGFKRIGLIKLVKGVWGVCQLVMLGDC